MKIRTQIYIPAAILSLVLAGMLLTEWVFRAQSEKRAQVSNNVYQSLRDTVELSLLIYETALHSRAGSQAECERKIDALEKRVGEPLFSSATTAGEFQSIRTALQSMENLLQTAGPAQRPPDSPEQAERVPEISEEITRRLIQESQALNAVFLAVRQRLREQNLQLEARERKTRNVLIVLLLGGALAAAAVLDRRIARALQRLEHGAVEIGKGNLDFSFPAGRHDEISIVENTFNAMTDSLKKVLESERQAKEEIRVAEEKFRSVVEAANAMVIVDGGGRIIFANEQVKAVFGYQPEELTGQSIEQLVPPRFREKHIQQRAEIGSNPRPRHMGSGRDLVGLRKDGSEVAIEIGLNRMRVPEKAYLASIIDITERKKGERELELKNKELETLLYVVSHDLKEPLRGIEYFSTMIQERYSSGLPREAQDYLERSIAGAARLRHLLHDILSLSKARKIQVPSVPVPLSEIIEEALKRLELGIRQRGAKISVQGDFPALPLDRTWATEAVYNLVNNALKYTKSGEAPEIEIVPYVPPKEAREAGLAVRDRGPGIDPLIAERMFELFQRGVGRHIEGTGAGLAIVRAVAERHGGRCWIEPREGGGTSVFVTFRASVENEAGPPASHEALR